MYPLPVKNFLIAESEKWWYITKMEISWKLKFIILPGPEFILSIGSKIGKVMEAKVENPITFKTEIKYF